MVCYANTPRDIVKKAIASTAVMWLVDGGSAWRRWRVNPAKCRSLIVRLCSALVYEHYTTRYIICVRKCGCACLNCLVLINVTSFKHGYLHIYIYIHVVNTEFHLYRQIYVFVCV